MEAVEPITVRFLRMSEKFQESLDYPSKLSRQPTHIAQLIADGEAQAGAFLTMLDEVERLPDSTPARTALELQ